ncbi:MAG TPA: hypothetical protein PLM53_01045 [Spirochaetota bacterium]|nr:hypothetical protein [Spirochaetota bacterium]HPC39391.1 hypothetical protein [Spirochaetota bacterium]HPL16878.1 hypothetical protein [Spirochaetota bacterium]HQF06728.1 hypothetical protein [Spirochaetota bacterium]HQH95653.1 hypothetical protein [Spirochaetota bacterium]
MKTRTILITLLHGAAVMLFSGCILDPDRKLNNAIEQYHKKEPKAFQALESEFISYIAIDSLESADFHSTGTLLYRTKDNSAEVIYPSKQKYRLTDENPVIAIDRTDDYAVVSDGIKISIFEGNGDHLNDETVGDKKNRVRAVLIDDDSILYYKNSKLYRYSIMHHSSEQFLKDSFPPPYTNYYNVHLAKREDILTVITGIAGSHSLNLINMSTGSVVIKNLAMSSSKHHVGVNAIRYISGNSGNWELMQYAIDTKAKKSLGKLTDIIDIELTSQGYVLESSTGLWAAEYGKDARRIPFSYKLGGSYKGRVLLQYRDVSYFIDMKRLFSGIATLMEQTPDLFAPSKH